MARYHEVTETKAASGTPQRGSLVDGVRRLAYASLGLFSVMTDEVETFYEKCVTRGEQKAKEARAATRERQAARQQEGRRREPGSQSPRCSIDRAWRPSPKWMPSSRGSMLCHMKSMRWQNNDSRVRRENRAQCIGAVVQPGGIIAGCV